MMTLMAVVMMFLIMIIIYDADGLKWPISAAVAILRYIKYIKNGQLVYQTNTNVLYPRKWRSTLNNHHERQTVKTRRFQRHHR